MTELSCAHSTSRPGLPGQRKIAPVLTTSNRARIRIVQSRQNSRVKELRSGFARASLSDTNHISIEGEHLLAEAVRSDLRIVTLFLRQGADHLLSRIDFDDATEILELPVDVFASAVTTDSPQGIAALIEAPRFTLDDAFPTAPHRRPPLIVVAAALQDPGNLGTLIRSAEAFGATAVLTLPGTVSPWNPKALRASSGSAFRLPVIAAREEEAFAALAAHDVRIFAAVAESAEAAPGADLSHPTAILIGNEGAGLPPALIARADARITIPCPGPVESLNAGVAASILLYEASRQRAATSAPQIAGPHNAPHIAPHSAPQNASSHQPSPGTHRKPAGAR
jgi:TrmH family RNA methyltransferase